MTRRTIARRTRFAPCALIVGCLAAGAAAQNDAPAGWVTAWGTSQNGVGATSLSNATVRLIARVTVPGTAVRLRFDNTFGTESVELGAVYVGHRALRETLAEGSNRRVTFGGAAGVRIPAGGSVTSDPVAMTILAREDLAVSLHVPGTDVRPSQHGGALVTSYLTANGAGNVAGEEVLPAPGQSRPEASPFTGTTTSTFWLKAIDVQSPTSTGAIVALGDSITDGTCSTVDGWDRWVDWLSVRLALAGIPKAVVNEGIGGNTIGRAHLRPAPNSVPALERLDRDVLSHHGVSHVILFEGTNDIRRDASAEQVISGMTDISQRVRARGIRIVGVTIVPRHNLPPAGDNTGWDDAKSKTRRAVNEWIRSGGAFDAVLDFDRVMRDPSAPDRNYPSFHCDGIHPNPRGYYEIGKSVPLDLFGR